MDDTVVFLSFLKVFHLKDIIGTSCSRYEVAEFQRRVRQNYKELTDETWVEICADGSLEEVEGKLLDIVNKELVKERGAVSRLWQVLSCVTFAFFNVDTLGVQDRGGGVNIEVRGSPAARSENIFHYFVLFVHQSAFSSKL